MTDTAAWDTYSKQKPERRPVNAAGETTWFNWSQYPDHGPGTEVLNLTPGANVLDLTASCTIRIVAGQRLALL
ncbi:hypothetical protein [Streptomyces globisporus]|uniref:hypothetical protein n=1 Tax=Streptomyces globisporus TaxID=1908 RepID=UPI00378F9C3F